MSVVQVDPSSLKRPATVNLHTASEEKFNRLADLKKKLDQEYQERLAQAKAEELGLPYINLYGFPVNINTLTKIPKEQAQTAEIAIIGLNEEEILLVTPNPSNTKQTEIIQKLSQEGKKIVLHYCSYASFQVLLEKYRFAVTYSNFEDSINITEEKINFSDLADAEVLRQKWQNLSISQIVEGILIAAIKNNASDIHFEPEKEVYNVRLRIDGVLHTFFQFPPSIASKIEDRIKVMSKVKINIDNQPQDGRFSFFAGSKEIDMRVSFLPSNYGYSIVMRLLGTGAVNLTLEDLGFLGTAKNRAIAALFKSTGMVLTTGPTGSGKTTTLYTFLKALNNGENKIITLEDPIEYKLSGISQTQIDHSAGYDFASGLRSILRQDPDVVMVGEIRDKETADVAVQAALTGHKVLSTIHTNDAAGALPRLMEMGIKGFLLADALNMIIGQRLVRRLCPHCRRETALKPEEQAFVEEVLSKMPTNHGVEIPSEIKFYTSDGCPQCSGIGYKGRIGVYEVLTVTDGIRDLLSRDSISFMDVRRTAASEGVLNMQQDAVVKAILGITDVKEVMRVVG